MADKPGAASPTRKYPPEDEEWRGGNAPQERASDERSDERGWGRGEGRKPRQAGAPAAVDLEEE